VQRNGIPIGIFPIGNAGWNFPVLLIFGRQFARRRTFDLRRLLVLDRSYFLVLVSRWVQRVFYHG